MHFVVLYCISHCNIAICVHVFQDVFFLHIFHLVVHRHCSPFVLVRLVVHDLITLINLVTLKTAKSLSFKENIGSFSYIFF